MEEYFEKNLKKDEQIILEGKIAILPHIILIVIMFLLFITFLAPLLAAIIEITGETIGIMLGILELIIPIILGLFIICGPLFARLTTKLCFTSKKIIGKTGCINSKAVTSPLHKIDTVSVSSGFFGKIFDYGKIVICTNSAKYSFPAIVGAEKFRIALMNQIDQAEEDKSRNQAIEIAQAIKDLAS